MEDIYNQAKKIILKNIKKGIAATANGPLEYTYVCPSKAQYPHQWLWDSCFHTIVSSRFNRRLATAELRTLATRVQDDGFIPQITVWKPSIQVPVISGISRWIHDNFGHYTKVTQPPVFGIALEEVYRNTQDVSLLDDILPKAKRHYEYFLERRDPDKDGLISIIMPIESGMDHSPAYDKVIGVPKPTALHYHIANMVLAFKYKAMDWDIERILDANLFSVEDLTVNCIFASGLRSIARLCREAGDEDAARFDALALRTEQAIIDRCYDAEDGVFYSLAGKDDRKIRVKTVASLMPLLLESLPDDLRDEIVYKHLLNPNFFWLKYPVPSVSMCQDEFSADSAPLHSTPGIRGWIERGFERMQTIWRGPTWVNTNWFLSRGLRLHGFGDIADELTEKTARMISQAGFWEYYNPLTGEGQGAEGLSWSTLILDMLESSPEKERILAAIAVPDTVETAEPKVSAAPVITPAA